MQEYVNVCHEVSASGAFGDDNVGPWWPVDLVANALRGDPVLVMS
jgi:hypothetical protein